MKRLCSGMAVLWFLIVCISGASIQISQQESVGLLRPDLINSYHVKRSVSENTTPEQQCLEDLEDNKTDDQLSSLTPTVKQKRCPRERRLGTSLASKKMAQDSAPKIPIERRDLLDHLKSSCDSCKARHNCVEGPCQICDVYCKALTFLPNKRTSEMGATLEAKPIVQRMKTEVEQESLPLGTRSGVPVETISLVPSNDNHLRKDLLGNVLPANTNSKLVNLVSNGNPDYAFPSISEDDEDVLIVGSKNSDNENELDNISPLSPPTNSVLGKQLDDINNQQILLTSRLGISENTHQYRVATIDSGSIKELILHLVGIHNTTDIEKLMIYVTTHSSQAPIQTKPSENSFPSFESFADRLKQALQQALEKRIHEQGVNFMTNEEIDKLIVDTLSQMRQENALTENVGSLNEIEAFDNRMLPGTFIVPQIANPDIIEGPPDISTEQEARMTDPLEASPSETKFNIVVPDEYLGWSKGGDSLAKIGSQITTGEGEKPLGQTFQDSSLDVLPQSSNDASIPSVNVLKVQSPKSADHAIDTTKNENILTETINDSVAENEGVGSGRLPSPKATFNRLIENFRNSWNRRDELNKDNRLRELEPDSERIKPLNSLPKSFMKPLQISRTHIINPNDLPVNEVVGEGYPLESKTSDDSQGGIDKISVVKAVDPKPNLMAGQEIMKKILDKEPKLSLKEMTQNLINGYKNGHKGINNALDNASKFQEPSPNLGESNNMFKSIDDRNEAHEELNIPTRDSFDQELSDTDKVLIEPAIRLAESKNEEKIIGIQKNGDVLANSRGNNAFEDEVFLNRNMENTVSQSKLDGSNPNILISSVRKKPEVLENVASNERQDGEAEIGLDNDRVSMTRSDMVNTKLNGDTLSEQKGENVKPLLDAGPFVSRGRELYNKYVADQLRKSEDKHADEKPYISRGRDLYNKFLLQQKDAEASNNKDQDDKNLGSSQSDTKIQQSEIENFDKSGTRDLPGAPDSLQTSGWSSRDALDEFEVAQRALGRIQELSEKLGQETKLRKPIDQNQLDYILTDLDRLNSNTIKVTEEEVKDANTPPSEDNSKRQPVSGIDRDKEAIIGSQPLENSFENRQPVISKFTDNRKQAKDNLLGNTPSDKEASVLTHNRAGFDEQSLSTALKLKDENDIALSLTNPKELYFVSNGDKLPLQITKSDNGEIHLSVDVEKLCSCKNSSCPANHTSIDNTVSEILENEAKLKEELKPIVEDALSSNIQESVLAMESPVTNDNIPTFHSRSLFDTSLNENQALDLVARNEREIGSKNSETITSSQNLDISRRSLTMKDETMLSSTESSTLQNITEASLLQVPSTIPTQTILVGERTKLQPSRDQNYFTKLLTNLPLQIWNKPKVSQDNIGFTTPSFLKRLFDFGQMKTSGIFTPIEATTLPSVGSRSKSTNEEDKDLKMPINKLYKFAKLDSQLDKLEKIDKSVDKYVKDNDKILENETKTILGTNQDPATRQEVGIMSNILNWFKKLALDRGKK